MAISKPDNNKNVNINVIKIDQFMQNQYYFIEAKIINQALSNGHRDISPLEFRRLATNYHDLYLKLAMDAYNKHLENIKKGSPEDSDFLIALADMDQMYRDYRAYYNSESAKMIERYHQQDLKIDDYYKNMEYYSVKVLEGASILVAFAPIYAVAAGLGAATIAGTLLVGLTFDLAKGAIQWTDAFAHRRQDPKKLSESSNVFCFEVGSEATKTFFADDVYHSVAHDIAHISEHAAAHGHQVAKGASAMQEALTTEAQLFVKNPVIRPLVLTKPVQVLAAHSLVVVGGAASIWLDIAEANEQLEKNAPKYHPAGDE